MLLVEQEIHNGGKYRVPDSEGENSSSNPDDGSESSFKTTSTTLSRMTSSCQNVFPIFEKLF